MFLKIFRRRPLPSTAVNHHQLLTGRITLIRHKWGSVLSLNPLSWFLDKCVFKFAVDPILLTLQGMPSDCRLQVKRKHTRWSRRGLLNSKLAGIESLNEATMAITQIIALKSSSMRTMYSTRGPRRLFSGKSRLAFQTIRAGGGLDGCIMPCVNPSFSCESCLMLLCL